MEGDCERGGIHFRNYHELNIRDYERRRTAQVLLIKRFAALLCLSGKSFVLSKSSRADIYYRAVLFHFLIDIAHHCSKRGKGCPLQIVFRLSFLIFNLTEMQEKVYCHLYQNT